MYKNHNLKIVLQILSTILLAQKILAHPTARENTVTITAREDLLNYATQEYTKLATNIVQETIKIFERVLKHVESKPNKNLEPYIRDIQNFVDRSKGLSMKHGEEKTTELFELFDIGANLTTKFDTIDKLNAQATIVEMDTLLKQCGVDELSVNFVAHFLRLINSLEQQVENYLKSLSEDQKRYDQRMVDWHQRVENELNVSNKIDLFVEFFHLYEQ